MLTYGDIVSQVAGRLGYKAYEGMLKENISQAINWAEHELLNESEPAHRTVDIPLKSTKSTYSLSGAGVDDFASPVEILAYDSEGNRFDVSEVPYDEWLRFNPIGIIDSAANDILPSATTESLSNDVEQMALYNKLVVSIRFDPSDTGKNSDWIISTKPSVDGMIRIRYSIIANRDIFRSLARYPRLPGQFHHYIIPGAVKFLAELEAGQAMSRQDQLGTSFYLNIQERANSEFTVAKTKVLAKKEVMTRPAIARADQWYDDPRKYKNA
jgi:hypothetical protein